MNRQYVTTAIDYPNAPPHMGHVLEKVLADVTARWFRLRGDEVRFQIGTDEHGVKIQQTAEKEGISPKELVDRNAPLFQKLYDTLTISYDHFIRTSDQKEHWPTVIELWKRLKKTGMLEKKSYVGLYCSGCERFMTKRDLVDGKCPNHQIIPEEVKEENWFFLLSKDAENLRKLLTGNWNKEEYRIVPDFRAQETLSLIEQGLEDVSFSRPKTSLSWGIPVPEDENQTMYVWCDALTNYISGLDYFDLPEGHPSTMSSGSNDERPSGKSRLGVEWWDDAEVTHVIGKDIARFHALYWPSMLHHAKVRIPDRLLIHGFLTSEGEKMSKSLGNVVVPSEVMEKYGVDPLRFYLSHEIPVGRDGDFSWDRMRKLYDSKLRNDIGNLLNRVLILLQKDGCALFDPIEDQSVESLKLDLKLLDWNGIFHRDWGMYNNIMDGFQFYLALTTIITQRTNDANRMMDEYKPWSIKDPPARKLLLSTITEILRHISLMLLPFIPKTAQRISQQLGVPYAEEMLRRDFVIGDKKGWGSQTDWKQIGKPEILFAPVE